MALAIQTNVASLEAQKNLNSVSKGLQTSFNRLSSGYRINSAADDAAGLAISDNFRAQIRSFSVAERNANDGVSMAQTAEGALGQVTGLLTRMRELGFSRPTVRRALLTAVPQHGVRAAPSEMNRIQESTTYDGNSLIKAATSSTTFQVGINNATTDQIAVTFGGLTLTTLLAATTAVSGSTSASALNAIDRIDAALSSGVDHPREVRRRDEPLRRHDPEHPDGSHQPLGRELAYP